MNPDEPVPYTLTAMAHVALGSVEDAMDALAELAGRTVAGTPAWKDSH